MTPPAQVEVVRDARQARVILGGNRRALLEALVEPDSASGLARRFKLPRQRINYHLRLLEKAGLVELVEQRRRGNCLERLVRATARAFVISPDAVGGPAPGEQAADRASVGALVGAAADAIRQVAALDAKARTAGKRIATLTLDSEIRFASAESRSRFMEDLVAAAGRLVARYHDAQAPSGRSFRFLTLVHPVAASHRSGGADAA